VDSLKGRFRACLSGQWVGASMGKLTEGQSPLRLLSAYDSGGGDEWHARLAAAWLAERVASQELLERTKLIAQAVIDRSDRIRAEDLSAAWLRYIDMARAREVLPPYEISLMEMAAAGIPAVDIGRYCDYTGLNSFACSCLPLGLINACDPETAAHDAQEVGRLYQAAGSSALKWAAFAAASVAAALQSHATVGSVLESAFGINDSDAVSAELHNGLDACAKCRSPEDLMHVFDSMYSAGGIPYAMSFAKETITKGLCILHFADGDVKEAVALGALSGRDAPSTAAFAGALGGALGCSPPEQWRSKADRCVDTAQTFRQIPVYALADELHGAVSARIGRLSGYCGALAKRLRAE
jgi:ADP-ribosylglycohydrolase